MKIRVITRRVDGAGDVFIGLANGLPEAFAALTVLHGRGVVKLPPDRPPSAEDEVVLMRAGATTYALHLREVAS